MFSPSGFRDLVSKRKSGVLAALLRLILRLLEFPYTWAVRYRNRKFDLQSQNVHFVDVPVISVGNLSMGGTGKTPMVEWIARKLRDHNCRVVLISRGYGSEIGKPNDEALELELALPDVPHLQNPDRIAAAYQAISEYEANLLLLDDGFQHRRLGRNLDIVLLDASEPFGYEHVFPRGMLREPLEGLSRADVVILSRAEMIDRDQRDRIRSRIFEHAPKAVWAEVAHRPKTLINCNAESLPIGEMVGKKVAAFCGIGNPQGFQHTLLSLGCEIASWREFPDHHEYGTADISEISKMSSDVELILCTRKDLVKLREAQNQGLDLWALSISLEFMAGEKEIEEVLLRKISK